MAEKYIINKVETSTHSKNGAKPKSLMSRENKKKGEIMNFKKFYNLIIGCCMVALVMSCSGTKKSVSTTKVSDAPVENSKLQQEFATAIKGNNLDLIKYALDNGATLNTATEEGKELFMHSVKSINDFELFKRLVENTTDIDAIVVTNSQQSRNALHHLIADLQQQKTQDIYLDKAIYLLEKGITVFENNWWKQNEDYGLITTVLVYGGTRFDKASVLCTKLIEAGANVNGIAFNRSPLYAMTSFAFRPGGGNLFELLIEKGADVNFAFNKLTPLDSFLSRLDSDNDEIRTKAKRIVELLKLKGAKTFAELEQ